MCLFSRRSEDSSSAATAVLLEKVDDLQKAAEGLQAVSESIRHLSEVAESHLPRPGLQRAKEAIACLVCKGMYVCNTMFTYFDLLVVLKCSHVAGLLIFQKE